MGAMLERDQTHEKGWKRLRELKRVKRRKGLKE